jgi:hypothetical protein
MTGCGESSGPVFCRHERSTNLGFYRQDGSAELAERAKFAKVDLLTKKKPQFPWRPWRLGGDFLEVTCLTL